MKPWIGRSEEFLPLFAPLRNECWAARFENTPMHQIAKRFAHKCIAMIFAALWIASQCIAAVNREPGQRVEMARGFFVENEWWWRERKNFACVSRRQQVLRRRGREKIRIAREISFFDNNVPDGNRVPGKKPVSPIVASRAELARPCDRFE